jgi:hypothetical protein
MRIGTSKPPECIGGKHSGEMQSVLGSGGACGVQGENQFTRRSKLDPARSGLQHPRSTLEAHTGAPDNLDLDNHNVR